MLFFASHLSASSRVALPCTEEDDMIQRFTLILISLCVSFAAHAAMLRVIDIQDGRTIVIERDGVREPVTLAGVEIIDEAAARDLLYWTLSRSWVMVERSSDGGQLVYRSPDALFINRELVLRGFAHATLREVSTEPQLAVTYLGQIDPPALRQPTTRSSSTRQTASESGSRTRSGTGRRSKVQPSRPAKPPRPSAPAPRTRAGSAGRSSGS